MRKYVTVFLVCVVCYHFTSYSMKFRIEVTDALDEQIANFIRPH